MPVIERNHDEETAKMNAILNANPRLKKKFEADQKEFEFRIMLARIRKENNLPQNAIAEEAGLTQQAVSRIERGTTDRSPTLNTLIKYVDALGYELTLSQKRA